MIEIKQKGDFSKADALLASMLDSPIFKRLESYAQRGLDALILATPLDSGITAASWSYRIERAKGYYAIVWTNDHAPNGFPVAIMLQYGHGTGTGGYVQGQDYINPSIRPIFDSIADSLWKEVSPS